MCKRWRYRCKYCGSDTNPPFNQDGPREFNEWIWNYCPPVVSANNQEAVRNGKEIEGHSLEIGFKNFMSCDRCKKHRQQQLEPAPPKRESRPRVVSTSSAGKPLPRQPPLGNPAGPITTAPYFTQQGPEIQYPIAPPLPTQQAASNTYDNTPQGSTNAYDAYGRATTQHGYHAGPSIPYKPSHYAGNEAEDDRASPRYLDPITKHTQQQAAKQKATREPSRNQSTAIQSTETGSTRDYPLPSRRGTEPTGSNARTRPYPDIMNPATPPPAPRRSSLSNILNPASSSESPPRTGTGSKSEAKSGGKRRNKKKK